VLQHFYLLISSMFIFDMPPKVHEINLFYNDFLNSISTHIDKLLMVIDELINIDHPIYIKGLEFIPLTFS